MLDKTYILWHSCERHSIPTATDLDVCHFLLQFSEGSIIAPFGTPLQIIFDMQERGVSRSD